jgi:hypothetical protein
MTFRDRVVPLARVFFATTSVALIAGCGTGALNHSVTPAPSLFSATVHGGENPITYSLVTLYETANTGVATAVSTSGNGIYIPSTPLTPLGSMFTDVKGGVHFSTPLACSNPNDYVYATAAGGNPGNNAINSDILLMATVGPCAYFGGSTNVEFNEVTTVAAAYALSGFTSITGSYTTSNDTALTADSTSSTSDGNTNFSTSANNLASGQIVTFSGCTLAGGSDPAGPHAVIAASSASFQISGIYVAATNCTVIPTIVSTTPTVSVTSSTNNYLGAYSNGVYAPTSSSPSGLAHAFANAANLVNTVTGYPNMTSPSNSAALMPTALINTLGNVLQSCVNSTGGVASSTASSGCPKLFYNTIIQTSVGSTTTTNTPANTLQAALNIAHAPTQNVTNILSVAPSNSAAFAPAVASPTDFSMAIAYPQLTGNTVAGTTCSATSSSSANGLCYPIAVTVDYADNVYVLNTTDTNNGSTTNVVSFTFDGGNRYATDVTSTYGYAGQIAADNLGNVFFTNQAENNIAQLVNASTSTSPTVTPLAVLSGIPQAIAIDTANNLYVSSDIVQAGNLYKYPYGSYNADPTVIGTGGSNSTFLFQLALDASGNIWGSQFSGGSAVPTAVVLAGGTAVTSSKTEITAGGATDADSFGMAVDSSGNAWDTSSASIYKVTHTGSGTALTSATSSTIFTGGSFLQLPNFDGNNNFLTTDYQNNTLDFLPTLPTTYTVQAIQPCIATNSSACPVNTTAGFNQPISVQADSAGSIWVANYGNGSLIQVIGLGAPAWPLATQKPGLMP